MSQPLRTLLLVLMAAAVSLMMVLVFKYRALSETQLAWHWLEMMQKHIFPAPLVQDWFGNNPPILARDLAVTWWQARPLTWWWLPALVLIARWLVLRKGSRRRG